MESRWRQTFNNTCVACSYKDPVRYTLSPAKGKEVNVLTVPDIDKDARKREVQGGREGRRKGKGGGGGGGGGGDGGGGGGLLA